MDVITPVEMRIQKGKEGREMSTVYRWFSDKNMISEKEMNRICESLFDTVKKELPEESQTVEGISAIFEECIEKVKTKRLQL